MVVDSDWNKPQIRFKFMFVKLIFRGLRIMRIVEFRIFVPIRLEMCRTASKYAVNKQTRDFTGGGEGFEVLETSYFDEEGVRGRYVHRLLHFKSQVPKTIRWALPEKYAHVHEHNRNSFPHYRCHFEIPGLGDNFTLQTETRHFVYTRGCEIPDNLNGFDEEDLKIRKVVYLDILNGPKTKKELDLHGFSCPDAGIHEMIAPKGVHDEKCVPEWVENYEGDIVMIVKTIKFEFRWLGLQSMVESIVCNNVWHDVYLNSHRSMIKWAQDWCNLTEQDLINFENSTKEHLNSQTFNKDDMDDTPPDENAPVAQEPPAKTKGFGKKNKDKK